MMKDGIAVVRKLHYDMGVGQVEQLSLLHIPATFATQPQHKHPAQQLSPSPATLVTDEGPSQQP